MEAQSLRTLRRHLDYGRRVKRGQGMSELYQWIGRILLDEGRVYSLEDRALAFEIGACERIADLWPELHLTAEGQWVVSSRVDRVRLYRQILAANCTPVWRAAFYRLFRERYKRHADWIEACAALRDETSGFVASGSLPFFESFLQQLDELEPLPKTWGEISSQLEGELARLQEENQKWESEVRALRQDLEFAEERANRAHQRLRDLDKEVKQLRKELREARENGEKLRLERKSRIASVRQSNQVQRELERLQGEYFKLEQRLQQMAKRLAQAESQRQGEPTPPQTRIALSALRQLDAGQVLGVAGKASAEEIGKIRRRFATVFHPDRVNQLPPWARILCDEVLSAVNEACDRVQQ